MTRAFLRNFVAVAIATAFGTMLNVPIAVSVGLIVDPSEMGAMFALIWIVGGSVYGAVLLTLFEISWPRQVRSLRLGLRWRRATRCATRRR